MPLDQNRPTLRSQCLSQITHALHEQLDKAVKAHAPFDTLASYSRFVVAQYLFQKELQPLYSDPTLQTIISDLPARCRAEQARADLADLNMDLPLPVAGAVQKPSSAEALGWLFVSEGSKLGAAFLIKRAQALNLSDSFGARHLGEPAGGRAAGWKAFVRTLDELPLTAEQEAELDRGAIAAFERFNVLLQCAYADAPVADMAQA
ncbi:biliverdin-producing heme oxygenase [Pseudomonas syringae]|uniref:biliverdin-producing heme oxygenase n=1 Tax=Pseudomonas syringae TaxID=317 RepID=UPI000CDA6F05|nr:biliverdin-producing heme oxygenase [Pseudomonas syringae]POR67762.1 biliverdin-producing heme oxygenase [Pseudomonas syringae pv. syringae]POR75174.1 biliverdin-producing heme oxygenase [Pseudomonas syringae pv. syringae]